MHGKRSPNLSTLRAIIHTLRQLYRTTEGEFIGLIVARSVLDTIQERTAEVDAQRVRYANIRSIRWKMQLWPL